MVHTNIVNLDSAYHVIKWDRLPNQQSLLEKLSFLLVFKRFFVLDGIS